MRASADALPRAGSSTVDMDRHGLPANWVCHPKQSMDSSSIRAANNVNERIAGSVGQRCRRAGDTHRLARLPSRCASAPRRGSTYLPATYRPRGPRFVGGHR